MKSVLSIFAITVLLACAIYSASAADVLDLSTLNRKAATQMEPVKLPQVSATMPAIAPKSVGGNTDKAVLDLSTLGKKAQTNVSATSITGANPITVTPSFSIKNSNTTSVAGSVITMPQAVQASATVYTPPIAIFGGA
jgi:hypothetical protein